MNSPSIVDDRQLEQLARLAANPHAPRALAIEGVFDRVRHKFVDDDGDGRCSIGARTDLVDIATDIDPIASHG